MVGAVNAGYDVTGTDEWKKNWSNRLSHTGRAGRS
jgi:hypothetical protein